MDNSVLKKRLNTFKTGKGTLSKVSNDVVMDVSRAFGVIVALGVSSEGRKYVLGIYQASSEKHQSCLNLLNDIEKRDISDEGILFVVDGGSGLNKALELKYDCHDKKKRRAIRIRCHIHSVPIRAQTRRLKCISIDKTFKSISLGQMVAA